MFKQIAYCLKENKGKKNLLLINLVSIFFLLSRLRYVEHRIDLFLNYHADETLKGTVWKYSVNR